MKAASSLTQARPASVSAFARAALVESSAIADVATLVCDTTVRVRPFISVASSRQRAAQ